MKISLRTCLALLMLPGVVAAQEWMEVPAGTLVSLELADPVHTGKNKAGDAFRGRVLEGVWVHGMVVIPPGTMMRGVLTTVTPSGRVKGRSQLKMTLQSAEIDGHSYAVRSDTLSYVGDPHAGKNIGSWLIGALQGAVYGVLFGGKEGAVIGAGAGTVAGGVSSVVQGKQDVEFPQGARLLFETTAAFKVPIYAAPKAQPQPASKPAT